MTLRTEHELAKPVLVAAATACFLFQPVPFAYAADQQEYWNKEYKFGFKFPAAWRREAPAATNMRAKIVSPPRFPGAGCAILIKEIPDLEATSQTELDEMMQIPPDKDRYQASLSQGLGDVSVAAVSQGLLGTRPAHIVRARYSQSSESGKQFASVKIARAFLPGQSLTLTCAGHGATPDEAEKAFEYWQSDIDNVFLSFRFQ